MTLGGFVAMTVHLLIQVGGGPFDTLGLAIVFGYLAFSIGIGGGLLLALRRPQWVEAVGIAVAFFAATFTSVIALVMWRGFAAEAPVSLLTKLPLAAAGIASMAAVALTLRPLYVAIAGTGVALTLLGFYGLAALDPATTFATNSAQPYVGPAVSTTRLIVELVFVSSATICMTLAVHFARQTMGEAIALQRSTDQISRYFSPDIARGILGGGDAFLRPGGKEQDVVVLFSDLAGYTRLCAGLPAGEVLATLSEYHERMVAEIFKSGGTLDKFMGDGIMATFGTPLPTRDAADRAVRTAQGMMTALATLNEDRARRELPPLAQRIGIHAGPAIVGNVGTSQRLEYTVIGDVVNVANRIQAKGKSTGRPAMMSAAVLSRLTRPVATEALGLVALDGQPLPIELHALTA
ncbi:adenylate/guanylate cyclase domain-containing protein [Reyranella sp.]|uniref:adenylate/guanylate cyclase domain-containing protein n=1 Tax=Reyranella sp. TaxID=1929291 RepID=UPI0027311D26|nr:adenylate/guanylate cyclase domain-containing protein [Reyranella sp.]MDP2377655.1 adenylate/guanylate cyclase domain-containing protein [Reyranella sp.]